MASVPDGHISKKFDEVLWPIDSESHSHCICISTTHRYNPSLNDSKGGWESTWDMEEHNGVRDFFYMKELQWYYLGTYQWAGQAIYPCNELRALINPRMHYLQKRAGLFPDVLPPAIAGIAMSIINGGVLKISCTGWRRIGFNTKLADALQSGRRSVSAANGGADPPRTNSTISIPKEGTRDAGSKAAKRTSNTPQDKPRKKPKHKKSDSLRVLVIIVKE
ncbi:hypothetical protein TRAPUB_10776 [Trametes pubescens]|uniref:Uncharacterized protein n=1 Tax=Trametes pubescens TaxID=154538 RepID=A0A1M2VYK6_TRAPU|nr:hypothetical protein TRAPUB_10776 [Trametes pubescens]